MERGTPYPGRTELRPVPALTTRAAVSFGGSWAPERGARARWVQKMAPPAAVGWTAQYRSSPCAAALRREVGKGMWVESESVASRSHDRSQQGSLFERVSFGVRSPAC
jgi:hypothetical protein